MRRCPLLTKVGDGMRIDPRAPVTTDANSAFGANEWLVDELYEQYLQDRHSVDPPGGTSSPTTSPDPARARR